MHLNALVVAILLMCTASRCERLNKQIYSSIEGGAACFRRLNGTHQVGCSSSDKGAVGAVHIIKELSDAHWLIHNGTAGPYVAVVSTALFKEVIFMFVTEPDNVAGVLLYDNATMRPDAYSQESQCPNEYSASPGSQCPSSQTGGSVWNEKGTGLLRLNIPFPIFYLNQSRMDEIDKIEQCYNRYNVDKDNQRGQPLCSIQLNSFMFAVLNTEVCMRRSASSPLFTTTKVCDPLGDFNVYYSLFPRGKVNGAAQGAAANKTKPVILVTARIDSASLFDGVAPGAASSVVGMVTLIMAAATLAQMIPQTDAHLYDKNVLWTLFNGESFDYIGSQRVAFDMRNGTWPPVAPLAPADVALHVELGQLGGSLLQHRNTPTWPVSAFSPYSSTDTPPPVKDFIAEISRSYGTNITEFGPNMPPSSIHSFRRILSNGADNAKLPPATLLVDHTETFTNMYYESVLDDSENIGYVYHNITIGVNGTFVPTEQLVSSGTMSAGEPQVRAARLATALAAALYQQLTGAPYAGNVSASAHLADEMLHCYLESQSCPLLVATDLAGGGDSAGAPAASLYVGVATWPNVPAVFAAHALALLTGEHLHVNRTQCDALDTRDNRMSGFSFYYLKGWNHTGVCIQTTMNLTQAVSPAFSISGYDMRSGEYSTWTESVWHAMWARVFVAAGGAGARAAAAAGSLATLAAAALTYWLHRHSAVVFNVPSAAGSDATAEILRSVNC